MAREDRTLKAQYEQILGGPLTGFDIVCFRFRTMIQLHQFNWITLMHHLRGRLYDANETLVTATIVFDKGSQNLPKVRAIATEEMEATEITPILK